MTSRSNKPNVFAVAANPWRGLGVRAIWSRAIFHPVKAAGFPSRADSKLAPCMARPNLFSGD